MAGNNQSEEKKKVEQPKTATAPTAAALSAIKPGMTIRVHQKIKEKGPKGEKERVQIFEGIVLGRRHGSEPQATITVRKISEGIGVEKIFPLYSPTIVKIEPVKQARVRHAKLYYLRSYKKRLKEKKSATA